MGQFRNVIESKKDKVNMLILGDYVPEELCLSKLVEVKEHLINEGFVNTALVRDFIDEEDIPEEVKNIHFLRKSYHYIKNWGGIFYYSCS